MVLQSPVSSRSMYDFQDSAFITSDTDFLGFRLGFRVQGQGLFLGFSGLGQGVRSLGTSLARRYSFGSPYMKDSYVWHSLYLEAP